MDAARQKPNRAELVATTSALHYLCPPWLPTLGLIKMKFRKPLKITSRTSSITNAFVQAIIPSVEPSAEEEAEALSILG